MWTEGAELPALEYLSQEGDSHLPPSDSAETHQHQSNIYKGRDGPAPAWVQTSPEESPGPREGPAFMLRPVGGRRRCWGAAAQGWGQAGMCGLGQGRRKVAAPSCTSPSVQHRLRQGGLPGSLRFEKGRGVTAGT